MGVNHTRIYIWNNAFIRMDCTRCGAWLCQYTHCTLSELRAEYLFHVTGEYCGLGGYCRCGRKLFRGRCEWERRHRADGIYPDLLHPNGRSTDD